MGRRPEQARAIEGREGAVAVDGRGGGVDSRVEGGKAGGPFLNVVGLCSGYLKLNLKGSKLILLPL